MDAVGLGCVMMVMMVKSLSNMRQGRQRADTRLPFGVMCAGKMGFALETGRLFKRRVPAVRQSFEQGQALGTVKEKVVVEYVDRIVKVYQAGATITKEVPIYVSQAADSACVVPAGFVRVHDAGANRS